MNGKLVREMDIVADASIGHFKKELKKAEIDFTSWHSIVVGETPFEMNPSSLKSSSSQYSSPSLSLSSSSQSSNSGFSCHFRCALPKATGLFRCILLYLSGKINA